MPSNFVSPKRFIQPDPRYQSLAVAKFCNCMMKDGKKRTAYKIFYDALEEVARRMKDRDPLDVFMQAIANVKPLIQVRSRRVGGATYQVPTEVKRRRATSLATRWILESTRKKKGRPMKRLGELYLLDMACSS